MKFRILVTRGLSIFFLLFYCIVSIGGDLIPGYRIGAHYIDFTISGHGDIFFAVNFFSFPFFILVISIANFGFPRSMISKVIIVTSMVLYFIIYPILPFMYMMCGWTNGIEVYVHRNQDRVIVEREIDCGATTYGGGPYYFHEKVATIAWWDIFKEYEEDEIDKNIWQKIGE